MTALSHRQMNPAHAPIARQKHPLATVTALMIAFGLVILLISLRVLFY